MALVAATSERWYPSTFLRSNLRDSRFHDFLNEADRQWLVQREVDGPFGLGEVFQFSLKSFDDRSRREQAAMVGKRCIPHEHLFALESGNPVADGLGGVSRDGRAKRLAHLVQSAAARLA